MTKKILAVLLAAVSLAAALAFASCGGDEYPPGTRFLTLYHWDNGGKVEEDIVEKVCKAFEATQDKIGVRVRTISSYEDQMKTLMTSSNIDADVFLVPDGNFGEWVSAGKMEPLSKRIEESGKIDLDKIWPSAVDRYRYDGTLMGRGEIYCLPKDISPYVMYYNKDLYDQYGVPYPDPDKPMTIKEATEQWQKFGDLDARGRPTDKHVYGTAQFNPEGLVWSNGADYLSEDRTEVLIDTPEFIEVYDYMQKACLEYYTVPEPSTLAVTPARTLFLAGKAATFIEARSMTASLRTMATFDWDIAPSPAFEVSPLENGWSGSVGFAVSTDSTMKDEAYALVEYFASPEGQMIMTESGFAIPLYNDEETIEKLYEVEEGKKPANTGAFLSAAEHQRAGLWQYLPGNRWKDALDSDSSVMFLADASKRLTAEQYLLDEKNKIENILRTDFPWLFESGSILSAGLLSP